MIAIHKNLENVKSRIHTSFAKTIINVDERRFPCLIAVSKTKSAQAVVEAYQSGQTVFGENYVQELIEKSNHPLILENCPGIEWHFIGHLQSNKTSSLYNNCRNLAMIQTVDSLKLAKKLNNVATSPLKVLVQVNSSNEENKSGVDVVEGISLVRHIIYNCPNLIFSGIMTIGSIASSSDEITPNPDFVNLVNCRKNWCEELNIPVNQMHLSMGMSRDYEHAIEMGSTMVRVGSAIFGERH